MPGQVSSTALVRYRMVDYSAPVAHAHKKVTIKGYVDRVEIALGAEIVARHRRSHVRGDVVYDPLHYLSLLEKKPGALDQAAPLRGWKLDPAFDTLRRLLEARFGPRGKREYIQTLRLLEDFAERQVTAAVQDAVTRRLTGFDAVKHLLLARIEKRPVHLELTRYPHLPQPFVAARVIRTLLWPSSRETTGTGTPFITAWLACVWQRSPGRDRGRSWAGKGAAKGGGCPFPMPRDRRGLRESIERRRDDGGRLVPAPLIPLAETEPGPEGGRQCGLALPRRCVERPLCPCDRHASSALIRSPCPAKQGSATAADPHVAHIFGGTGRTAAMDVVNREIGLCSRSRRRSDGS